MHKRRRKISIIPYLFVAPVIILLLVFNIAPLFVAFVTSAFDVSTTLSDARFVGFGNYVEVFQDSRFWNSLFVTFKWTIIEVPLQVLVAFFLSALLTKNTILNKFFRANFFLPIICSATATGIMWKFILHSNVGYLTYGSTAQLLRQALSNHPSGRKP